MQESAGNTGGCELSVPVSRSCSEASLSPINFDGLVRAIKQLNVRVETGQSMELCFTSGGASFKVSPHNFPEVFHREFRTLRSFFRPVTV